MHGQWSTRWTYILAAIGATVGLGNIWKFPYLAGVHGGSAFVLVYLLCVAILGIPMMMAEVMLGRRGRQNPIGTMAALAHEARVSRRWQLLGLSGTLAGALVLSYYSVIGGWTMAYIVRSGSGTFHGAGADQVSSLFTDLAADPLAGTFWHTCFMVLTMAIVARGVQGGLERAATYLMPALVTLLVILVGYAATTGFFSEGLAFLFRPDFSRLTGTSLLAAMGQAFFSLSLGMGTIMIYGSYVSPDTSIAKTSILIALADTGVAILAGLAIFPIVFANGLEPGAGIGLIFQTLPLAFAQFPAGTLFGTLFFILLLLAAWTSSISLIEPAVTVLVERYRMTRLRAAWWSGLATWMVGMGTVFSFNLWKDLRWFEKTFFELVDFLTANLMIPLSGFFLAIFAGWLLARQASETELGMGRRLGYQAWHILIRYVDPIALLLIFLFVLGLL